MLKLEALAATFLSTLRWRKERQAKIRSQCLVRSDSSELPRTPPQKKGAAPFVLPFAAGLEDRSFYHKERLVNLDCDVPISLPRITQDRFARLELMLPSGDSVYRFETVHNTKRSCHMFFEKPVHDLSDPSKSSYLVELLTHQPVTRN